MPTRGAKRRGAGWPPGSADIGWGNRSGRFEGVRLLPAVTPAGVITGCGLGLGPGSAKDQPLAATFLALRRRPHPHARGVGAAAAAAAAGPDDTDTGAEGRDHHAVFGRRSPGRRGAGGALPGGTRPGRAPAEPLWPLAREVARDAVANRHLASLADLDDALAARRLALADQPATIKAHTRFHWWPKAA